MTASVLGSTLGTAGTLAGAAVGSIIGAVATSLYAFGIRSTHYSVTSLSDWLGGKRADGVDEEADVAGTVDAELESEHFEGEIPDAALFAGLGAGTPLDVDTLDPVAPALSGPSPRAQASTRGANAPDAEPAMRDGSGRRVSARWVVAGALASAAIAFGVALGIITGIESTTGRSLSGSSGTTVSSVVAAEESTPTPTADATATADSAPTVGGLAAAEQGTATPTPSTETTEASPSPAATDSAQPTPAPTATTSSSTQTAASAASDAAASSGVASAAANAPIADR